MRPSDRRALEHARRQTPTEPVEEKPTGGLIARLFGFWLFHKIFGGGS